MVQATKRRNNRKFGPTMYIEDLIIVIGRVQVDSSRFIVGGVHIVLSKGGSNHLWIRPSSKGGIGSSSVVGKEISSSDMRDWFPWALRCSETVPSNAV